MAEDEQSIKKRRLQNACDECRRRKIRCDSATAPGNKCSNCVSLRIECTHYQHKKKRGPKIGPTRDARALVNAILSSSKPYVVPEDLEAVKEILVKLANHARSLDRQLSELAHATRLDPNSSSATNSPAASNDTPEPTAQGEVEDSIDSLAQDLRKLSVGYHYKRHFGKSSNYMLVQSAMDSRRDVLGDPSFTLAVFAQHKRPEFWKPRPWQTIPHRQEPSLIFPEGDHLRDLVNLFFTSVNPLFPLLHRPTFERSIAEGLHIQNRSFGATVLAVCAVGARQSDDPRDLYEGTTSEHGLGWKWFSQIPLMRESLTDPPSLYDLQRCSLSVLYLQATSTPEAAWTVVGIGIRSAQEMGVHRKPVPSGNSLEDELWKRAFWLLVSIDLFFSAFMGRPRATTHDDFDVDLPVECDDEYWENPDPEKAFVQPVGKPSVVSFFVALLRLLDIVSFAQSTLYSVRKSELWYGMGIFGIDWKRRAVLELDSALNKYVDTIPEHLKWDPDNPDPVFFQQSATLYAIYHWVQIQIHRPFIPRPGQEPILPFPSLEICCNAARKTIHIIERLHARMDKAMAVLESVTFIVSPLFTSTLILLLSIWRPKSGSESTSESSKGMEVVYRSMKLIQKYESRNSYAGRVGDILSAVITVGQLPRTKNRKSPQSSGEGADQNSVPSHAQVVVADLHDTFHNTAQTSSHNLSTISDATSSLSQPASFPSAHDGCGIFGPPQIQTDFFMHDMAPADISLFDVNFTGSQLMLQPPNQAVANPMWNAQPMLTENVAFSQEDWDSFMVSVNDIVTEAVEYRGY